MTYRLLGMRVDETSYAEATELARTWARRGESRYICCASVNNVMEAFDSAAFRDITNAADLVTPDGMPLVWGLRRLGARAATRVYGPDLMARVLAMAARENIPTGFYGAGAATLGRLLRTVRTRFPALPVAYACAPPFRPLQPEEDAEITEEIERSGARILFVGLSTPKQERWMAAHKGRVRAVMIGTGAAFDFLAGAKRQAPRWMRTSGLEWLFRLGSEPRRLGPRYLRQNPRFLALAAMQLLGWRGNG
ncbi:MAG: WecB/TagA/CpsF family glycosyltransferase [Bryobacterales bacterium]|nr:WecB/TagA/CpsF family glycosyltransferase [Bryobacterales bacterium]